MHRPRSGREIQPHGTDIPARPTGNHGDSLDAPEAAAAPACFVRPSSSFNHRPITRHDSSTHYLSFYSRVLVSVLNIYLSPVIVVAPSCAGRIGPVFPPT